jgi:hypothetical protein
MAEGKKINDEGLGQAPGEEEHRGLRTQEMAAERVTRVHD